MKRWMGILLGLVMVTSSILAAANASWHSTRFVLTGDVTTESLKDLAVMLTKHPGVKKVEPMLARRSVKVSFDSNRTTIPTIEDVIRSKGFGVEVATENQLKVSNYVIRVN